MSLPAAFYNNILSGFLIRSPQSLVWARMEICSPESGAPGASTWRTWCQSTTTWCTWCQSPTRFQVSRLNLGQPGLGLQCNHLPTPTQSISRSEKDGDKSQICALLCDLLFKFTQMFMLPNILMN